MRCSRLAQTTLIGNRQFIIDLYLVFTSLGVLISFVHTLTPY